MTQGGHHVAQKLISVTWWPLSLNGRVPALAFCKVKAGALSPVERGAVRRFARTAKIPPRTTATTAAITHVVLLNLISLHIILAMEPESIIFVAPESSSKIPYPANGVLS